VLIVEDNEDAAQMLAILIEAAGYTVQTAATGRSAVERAGVFHPDVVLVDLGLPDMDGYQTLAALKQLAALEQTRFIALSGRGFPEDIARSQQAGFHFHLVKPSPPDEVLALLRP
jgi:CheY-like chemotaxis protein